MVETVVSEDGTTIAFDRTGSGSPIVLVHGTTADRTRWGPIRPALDERFTVIAMDRRGRGDSGDADEYSLDREAADVVAVVEACDEPVVLLGHSFGALCALEAALRTDKVDRLVLYEPPFPVDEHEIYDEEVLAEIDGLLAAGEDERALEVFFREVAGLSEEEIAGARAAPNWPARVAAAHTIPRENAADGGYVFDASRFAGLTMPTLLLLGSESPAFMRAATERLHDALPDGRIVVLEGEAHVAISSAPDLFVKELLAVID